MKHDSKVFSDNNFKMTDPKHVRNQKFMDRMYRRAHTMSNSGQGNGAGGGSRAWSKGDREKQSIEDRILAVLGLLHSKGKCKNVHLDGTNGAKGKTRLNGYAKHTMSRARLNGVHGTLIQKAKKEGLI